jgi:hypothetical protein
LQSGIKEIRKVGKLDHRGLECLVMVSLVTRKVDHMTAENVMLKVVAGKSLGIHVF